MRSILRASVAVVAGVCALYADVKLPALISDHMVLQRGGPVRIWGKADPGERVTVEFAGQKVSAETGGAGRWEIFLKPVATGAAADLTVSGKNQIVVHDVVVGEVWVGSGQSNMEMALRSVKNAEEEVAQANYPLIRLFQVRKAVAETPQDDVTGSWEVCTPESARGTSAAGYFFSRHLYEKLGVPIGFIHSSWGGTPAQSWTSKPALDGEPALKFIQDGWQKTLENYPAAKERYDKALAAWKEEAAKAKAAGQTPPRPPNAPPGPGHQNTPAGLYNAMIAPLTPYVIRGAIWYQGESNASPTHAYPYRRLFRLMIEDWRQAWGQGNFPFLFVQLANFKSNGWWPLLRESQVETLALRNTGMAVIIDVGESNDIHPKNKQEVGRRLALAARALAYGDNLVYSGPIYRQVSVEPGRLRVWFDHVGGGLAVRGGDRPMGFLVAGTDQKFVEAEAQIDGDTVVVSSPQVSAPVAVRYAWADEPIANLVNREELPASPFRSDRWENAQEMRNQ